ncbi:MAG: tetratricopeptide repeat protein [Fimbriimonas ginsengisoli]|uniref:Tetratricopeptide repeat protein n=1 Tax=Fimbriimonas ginsengisoli TaxID=1005039 RepID=A0A931LUZ9_FIMGI|nr:tetratricopeptide repeat protein [Fimbriimonas ginsengisoli]
MVEEVERLMAQNDWEAAECRSRVLMVEHPTNARLRGYLGLCLYRKQAFEEASEHFRKAILLQPTFWEASLKLAQCLDRLMRYEEALEAAREAHLVHPGDPTLNVLIHGLERQVEDKGVGAWQRTTRQHNVTMANDGS